jgi:hypothetical protein
VSLDTNFDTKPRERIAGTWNRLSLFAENREIHTKKVAHYRLLPLDTFHDALPRQNAAGENQK